MPGFRQNAIRGIRSNTEFDAVVVGGGINGIAAFRDLALQGLRVLLVDRSDFSSGCSAAPSRMIHGGLRYLENGEFALVQESLKERDLLLRLAPHMVHPLPTTIPILSVFSGLFNAAAAFFGSGSKPARRGALAIKIGLELYDFVTRKSRVLPRHTFRGRRKTFGMWPDLTERLSCTATYYDAWIRHPERLAIELLLDTARDAPQAIALNYANITRSALGYQVIGQGIDQPISISTRVIVNATGAWIDETAAELGALKTGTKRIVSGTKGSHLIIDSQELHEALKGHMIFFENDDNRVCILFPYLGRVLAGSTDIKVDAPARVRCEPEEQAYIIDAVRSVFPNIRIGPSQVVFSFSGIRPLPVSDVEFTGRISRSHFVQRLDGEIPQLSMVGGKWTTFRAFAEQVTDDVLAIVGRPRIADTIDRPIGGGRNYPGDRKRLAEIFCREHDIAQARADYIAENYGTLGFDLLTFSKTRPDDLRLIDQTETTGAEIAWLIDREYVFHLADIVLRRTTLAITGRLNLDLIEEILAVTARELDWTAEHAAREREELLNELEHFHGVSRAVLSNRRKDILT